LPQHQPSERLIVCTYVPTLALAALFADFPLPDDAEPAPVFSA
jgi:Protein of unknown function (DUF4089)